MKGTKLCFIFILSLMVFPFLTDCLITPTTAADPYGEEVKIGFTWINGLSGASELIDIGYVKATDMGAQMEHREYRWDYLDLSFNAIFEWSDIYLARYPTLNSSIALSVINGNSSCIPFDLEFEAYTELTPDTIRFNDTVIVERLLNMTQSVMNVLHPSYISFGSEINGFFETYYDYEMDNITNHLMLEDYVNLCEQLYDFVKTNYTEVKVLTIFRYQPPEDIQNIRKLLPYFEDCCDIFGVSTRIFTDNFGYISQLDENGVLERYTSFANLSSKKFAITNAYTISDSRASGSEYYQESYVRHLFSVIKKFEAKLEFLCWYTVFDYPPGYLSTFFSPYLEVHATAGLLTSNGDPKRSYHAWIDEMRSMGRLTDYRLPWKTAIGSLTIVAVFGFLTYAYVMEGLQFRKEDEKKKSSQHVSEKMNEEKHKKIKEKKPTTIEFTEEGLAVKDESEIISEEIDENLESVTLSTEGNDG
ncbi:MAG: hypothetical protein JXA54_14500 [Candidatus Heimdallarchaeota archaeon]|nr:hypothetical protein [Candidatus Heimdallarchaeota archaeon]